MDTVVAWGEGLIAGNEWPPAALKDAVEVIVVIESPEDSRSVHHAIETVVEGAIASPVGVRSLRRSRIRNPLLIKNSVAAAAME